MDVVQWGLKKKPSGRLGLVQIDFTRKQPPEARERGGRRLPQRQADAPVSCGDAED